jgi:hypothetical protein
MWCRSTLVPVVTVGLGRGGLHHEQAAASETVKHPSMVRIENLRWVLEGGRLAHATTDELWLQTCSDTGPPTEAAFEVCKWLVVVVAASSVFTLELFSISISLPV